MSRSMLRREAATQQLDLFAFTPVILPTDRGPPPERETPPLRLVSLSGLQLTNSSRKGGWRRGRRWAGRVGGERRQPRVEKDET